MRYLPGICFLLVLQLIGTTTLYAETPASPDTTNPLRVLPVTFINVRAFEKGMGIGIEWSNLTEQNLQHYILERSNDGRIYENVDQVSAVGNIHLQEDYSCFDRSPFATSNFYRIRAVGVDGSVTYSQVVRVDVNEKIVTLNLYPNPVRGKQLSVQLSGVKKGNYSIAVYNKTGQWVAGKQLKHPGGSMTETLELPQTARPGIYSMMIRDENEYHQSRSFFVE